MNFTKRTENILAANINILSFIACFCSYLTEDSEVFVLLIIKTVF
jgi:hypothetical protein